MNKMAIRIILQMLNYFIFMALVWYFSIAPPYHQLEDNQAVITLTMAHESVRVEECTKRSHEELAKLPPNMRIPMDCPRERSPITVELLLDDKPIVKKLVKAPGLYEDQAVNIYHSVKVNSGDHNLVVWMNDDVNREGYTYRHEQKLTLQPEQLLVVEFDNGAKKFTFK